MDPLKIAPFLPQPTAQSMPEVVSSFVERAVAAFDADRNASLRDLLRALAILQARANCTCRSDREPRRYAGLARWQMTRILAYIDRHISEKIAGQELAKLINISLGQLFRAFKISIGIPPLRYVAARRLELACSLLRTTQLPVSEVALACGFSDQSHLCRVFRRALAASPAAWRRANAHDSQFAQRSAPRFKVPSSLAESLPADRLPSAATQAA